MRKKERHRALRRSGSAGRTARHAWGEAAEPRRRRFHHRLRPMGRIPPTYARRAPAAVRAAAGAGAFAAVTIAGFELAAEVGFELDLTAAFAATAGTGFGSAVGVEPAAIAETARPDSMAELEFARAAEVEAAAAVGIAETAPAETLPAPVVALLAAIAEAGQGTGTIAKSGQTAKFDQTAPPAPVEPEPVPSAALPAAMAGFRLAAEAEPADLDWIAEPAFAATAESDRIAESAAAEATAWLAGPRNEEGHGEA